MNAETLLRKLHVPLPVGHAEDPMVVKGPPIPIPIGAKSKQ